MSTILVVDDDRLILGTLERGLSQAGYAVTLAADGEEALRICRSAPPDLALVDFRLPGMSGVDLAKELSALRIPFVFLSAYGADEVVDEAARHGALGYLVKPVEMPQVIAQVKAALARWQDLHRLSEAESHLSTALAAKRDISTAVGILMAKHNLAEQEAFESLRRRARNERRRLDEVAQEVVRAAESLASFGPTTPKS